MGRFIAETTVRTSPTPYFRERMPWRVGTVRLDAGPSSSATCIVIVTARGQVRCDFNRLDKSGQAVLIALPAVGAPNMEDAPLMRELSSDPKRRRALITDGRCELALALAKGFADAAASTIFVGEAEGWRGNPLTRTAAGRFPASR